MNDQISSSFMNAIGKVLLGSPTFTILLLTCGWYSWRLWAFTILPYLRPYRPEELPYPIPFIGHLFSFWWNSGDVINAASQITKNTQKPAAISILGVKIYFVFDPSHVMATFRNSTTLSWDRFLDELLVLFGVDRLVVNGPLHRHNPDLEYLYNRINSRHVKKMTLRHFTEALYMRQLAVDKAEELSISFFQSFLEATRGPQLHLCTSADGTLQLELRDLVDHTVSRSVAQMLFGKVIFLLDEDFTKNTVTLADQMWRIVYQYPKWLAPEFSGAYERVLIAIERFAGMGQDKLASACFMMRTMLEAENLYDLDPRSKACLLCVMYIAAISNVQATTFWLISYLVFDDNLHRAIQDEIRPAFKNGTLDTNYIIHSCPLLMSTYNEVLRLHVSSNSVRIVDTPTKFGDKILEPGNILMVPFGYMHRNSRAWGEDHSRFDPTRFLSTRKDNSINNPAYRPFGAGGNSCPGKALAICQVLSSVAYFMHTYDISAPEKDGKRQSMPIALHSVPTIGTSVPQVGKDLVVQLTPRHLERIRHIGTSKHASTVN